MVSLHSNRIIKPQRLETYEDIVFCSKIIEPRMERVQVKDMRIRSNKMGALWCQLLPDRNPGSMDFICDQKVSYFSSLFPTFSCLPITDELTGQVTSLPHFLIPSNTICTIEASF